MLSYEGWGIEEQLCVGVWELEGILQVGVSSPETEASKDMSVAL